MQIVEAISHVAGGSNLSQAQMTDVMKQVMTGEATNAQIAGLLVALKIKGETAEEITGAALVMRELATPVLVDCDNLVDTCGTGGDGARIFNVSTAAAFVASAAGASVAKHGNRSVSSSSGSADLLEAAGVNLMVGPDVVARSIETIGLGFLFAPSHHSAMKHAIAPRRELGMRTIFNLLGPLTNPAHVKRQVVGVFEKSLCRPMAEVLKLMGSEHVIVVHSDDGLDEFSIAENTHVAELKDGVISEYCVDPGDFDLHFDDLSGLSVENAEQSLQLIRSVFRNEDTSVANKAEAMIALNAGAAIYVSGVSTSLKEGVAMAEDAIASGGALEKLSALAQFTRAASE